MLWRARGCMAWSALAIVRFGNQAVAPLKAALSDYFSAITSSSGGWIASGGGCAVGWRWFCSNVG